MKTKLTIIGLLLAGSVIGQPLLDPTFSVGFKRTVIDGAKLNGPAPGGGIRPFSAPFYVITNAAGIKTTNAVVSPLQNFPNKP